MTTPELDRWRKTPELVTWWDTQFNSPQGKILQEVLHSLSTSRNIHNINADVAARDAVLFVGQQQGFQQVMENMRMLAQSPLEAPKQPHANYGVVDEPPVTQKTKRKNK